MLSYFLLAVGMALLLFGGELLVRGAVGLAEKLAIPPLIIGLTIVSFGTSAPELFISVGAVLDDAGGIALGNVVGSNITNVMLVLGLPAMTMAIICNEKGIGKNLLVLLAVTIIFMGMLAKGTLIRLDGMILLGILALFLYDQFCAARNARACTNTTPDYHDEVSSVPTNSWVIAGLLVVGIAALPIGAEITIVAATKIAKTWHVSDEVIGLTVVALGTSLPELSTTLMAAIRKSSSVALGNIVGSNIFNIAAIMGLTVVIKPIEVSNHVISLDMWAMLVSTILLVLLAHYKQVLNFRKGLMMTIAYCVYVYLAFVF